MNSDVRVVIHSESAIKEETIAINRDWVYVCDALTFLLDNIFIRSGTKLYRQVVWIPMGTNCALLVADYS